MSEPDDPTEPTPATEVETASDLGPTEVVEPVEPVPVAADPVRTVSRRGAGLAMAACLLVGGLLGWLVADARDDDGGGQMISSAQEGEVRRGPGPMGPGGGYPGGPMGPHGGWEEHGPGGHWEGQEPPPWLEDGPRGGDGDDRGDDGADEDDGRDD